MHLHQDDFLDGVRALLYKQAYGEMFSIPSGTSIFPMASSQSKWKYARGTNFIRLSDGHKVYAFKAPTGISTTDDFELHQEPDPQLNEFEHGATRKGTAQVHRSDPGSVYFTLHEGSENPTFTFRHMMEKTWRGIPKKKKEPRQKTAEFSPVKWLANKGLPGLQRAVLSPGELTHNLGGGSTAMGMLGSAAIGAGGGLAYHHLKRKLYNTEEENAYEDMEGHKPLLRRVLGPAAALSLLGGAQASVLKPHYKYLAAGAGPGVSLF